MRKLDAVKELVEKIIVEARNSAPAPGLKLTSPRSRDDAEIRLMELKAELYGLLED